MPTSPARRRSLAALAATALAGSTVLTLAPAASAALESSGATSTSAAITRFAGDDRFDTAALLAGEYDTPEAAIVTTGLGFADGLAGSYLAALVDGPILLTAPTVLPDTTRQAIDDLDVDTVYILGGESAVSEEVANEIAAIDGVANTPRIAGEDRFATAAAVATFGTDEGLPLPVPPPPPGPDTVIVATGLSAADALAAGVTANAGQIPILLTATNLIPQATLDAIDSLAPANVLIAGGPSAVSDDVANQLAGSGDTTRAVERIAGIDRFDTAARFAAYNTRNAIVDDVAVSLANGLDFADSLALAPVAAQQGASILLTVPGQLVDASALNLQSKAIQTPASAASNQTLLVAGGTAAIDDDVATAGAARLEIGTTFVVDSAADDDGAGTTLREAIEQANASAGLDEIQINVSVTLAKTGRDEDANVTGDLDITDDVVITGNANTVDGADLDRIFEIHGADVVIDDLTITNGQVADADDATGFGGAIRVADGGGLSLTSATVSNSSASKAGGGIENAGSLVVLEDVDLTGNEATGNQPATAANGGALHATGPTHLAGGSVSGNTAALEGGGLWIGGGSLLTVVDTTLDGNIAAGDDATQGGGALFSIGSRLELTRLTVDDNRATGDAGSGGGILADGGTVAITSSTISNNDSARAGGGIEATTDARIWARDTAFDANSTGDAPGNGGAIHLTGPADATIIGGAVTANTAGREGGGFWNGSGTMSVTGTTFTGNVANGDAADDGGGALFNDGGTLVIDSATIGDTTDPLLGNQAAGTAGSGGGILNFGTLEVTDTVFGNNTSNRAGGGIETVDAPVTVTDSTFEANAAGDAPGNGGAIHQSGSTGETTVSGSTFSGNDAGTEGGGVWNAGTMTLTDATFDGNTAPTGPDTFNASGTLTVNGDDVPEGEGTGGGGGGPLPIP